MTNFSWLRSTPCCRSATGGLIALAALLAGCSSKESSPGITPPSSPPNTPATPTTPTTGPAVRMVVRTVASGLTIWPVEAGSLQFDVSILDALDRPTGATLNFEAIPQVPVTLSPQVARTIGFWWLRYGPNALNVHISEALDTTLMVEGVSAGAPPTVVTRFVLDSVDGKPLPFDWPPAPTGRRTLRSAEILLRENSWVLAYSMESPSEPGTQTQSVTGTTLWRDGIASLRTDLLEHATAVLERGGRLQLLAADSNFEESSWPLPGRRSDFRRVP